jgi:hypothetical protein
MNVGTAPTATPASTFTMYAHDYADVADKSCPHFRIEDGTVVRLNQDVSTLGLPKFAGLAVGSVAVSPTYAVDIRSAPCKLHMAPSNTDTGLWMDAIGSAELAWSCGATYNSYSAPNYLFLAKATTASGMLQLNGITSFYADTGLTVGATFIPTKHLSISLAGSVMVGGAAATSKFDVLDSATREPSLTVANAPISQIRSSTVALTFGIASTGVTWLQGRNYSADGISYDIALNPVGGKVGVGTLAPAVALDVNANSIRIRTAKTPATAGAAGIQGEVAWDAGYVYVCVATNTWKRAAIATW